MRHDDDDSSLSRSLTGLVEPLPSARTRPTSSPFVGPAARLPARAFDDDGRLDEALPLYAARARQTATQADRLRYAGALLRARADRTRRAPSSIELSGEEGSIEHGESGQARSAAVAASTAIRAGRPAVGRGVRPSRRRRRPARRRGRSSSSPARSPPPTRRRSARDCVRALAKDAGALSDAGASSSRWRDRRRRRGAGARRVSRRRRPRRRADVPGVGARESSTWRQATGPPRRRGSRAPSA